MTEDASTNTSQDVQDVQDPQNHGGEGENDPFDMFTLLGLRWAILEQRGQARAYRAAREACDEGDLEAAKNWQRLHLRYGKAFRAAMGMGSDEQGE